MRRNPAPALPVPAGIALHWIPICKKYRQIVERHELVRSRPAQAACHEIGLVEGAGRSPASIRASRREVTNIGDYEDVIASSPVNEPGPRPEALIEGG